MISVYLLLDSYQNGTSGAYSYDGTIQHIGRLEHGEPDFGEATNPAGQGLWRVTPKVLSNSKHTLLCL
nr:MAG TPA: hypothetical protein [Caudoviricetes sp.]